MNDMKSVQLCVNLRGRCVCTGLHYNCSKFKRMLSIGNTEVQMF